MDLITDLAEAIAFKNITNLYFLLPENLLVKNVSADAVRAGFQVENLHFTEKSTKSHDLAGIAYTCSDELLYRHRNRSMPTVYHEQERSKKFTALVRTHKEWRAYTMARLWSKGLHESGYFGYNNQITVEEDINPIIKLRDRTIILTGFSGGFRRNEIVSLNYDDIEFVSEGVKIILRKYIPEVKSFALQIKLCNVSS